ncbi:MAG TPA: sodium/proton antiporter NhaB [Steroidobacteraceae bacterium]
MKPELILAAFLGRAPGWYKLMVIALLAVNPVVLLGFGSTIAGWLVLMEFIFILAMTLQCYPLQPGGLLALEAILMGMTDTTRVYEEIVRGFPVILLLMFMLAGVYFLKDLLLAIFMRLLLAIRSKALLALTFCAAAAVLSAFLDALTVLAVVIAVGYGCYGVYHRVACRRAEEDQHEIADDSRVAAGFKDDLDTFRAFLRSLMMHAAVGTALGGVSTLVGEPQNLLVAQRAGWNFIEFFLMMAPVSIPVLIVGLVLSVALERLRWCGYGAPLPASVRKELQSWVSHQAARRGAAHRWQLWVQGAAALAMVFSLAFHVAEVGLVGLLVIVLVTAFSGIVEEHRLGEAFHDAMPFTALLVVFFVIVSVINVQDLFKPVMHWVFALEGRERLAMFYLANGALSSISDNIFVATIFIHEIEQPFGSGLLSREQFDALAVALNTGVNIPSIATPNGQAAFLFLLSSSLAPLIGLSYTRMVWMALPYFAPTTVVGLLAVLRL